MNMTGYEMTYASIRQVASVGCPFCSILWGNVGEALPCIANHSHNIIKWHAQGNLRGIPGSP